MATSAPVAPALSQAAIRTTPNAAHWSAAKRACAIALSLRVFYSIAGALFAPLLRLDPRLIHSNELTGNLIDRPLHPALYALLGIWERFDTLWYIHIANHGYDGAAATVFYPLYPALIHVLSLVTHSDLVSALAISTAGSFFLFWGALRLFELDFPRCTSNRALLIWLVWPASFTLFAGYPDSVLCALIVWSIYFARSGRWSYAAIFGFLAGLTKAAGCVAALPLLWLAYKRKTASAYLAALIAGAGTVCFQAWLALRHFPSPASTYAAFWHTITVAPWVTLFDSVKGVLRGGDLLLILNVIVLVAAGYFAMSSSVRLEYRIFAAALICLFLTKHTQPLLQSTTRYTLLLFPAFPAIAARLGKGMPLTMLAIVAGLINLLFFRIFLDWGLVV